ncbi:MAG: cell division protein ZapA [Alphaproteobacteria bacterium]|nr:MAG: cell division protein ZapA [Alphaproteobacteria bacterium]
MAEVTVEIVDRRYRIACRDGDEERVLKLASDIDSRARGVMRTLGPQGEARLLLIVALLLADELEEARSGSPAAAGMDGDAVRALAARLTDLAARLASGAPAS